MKQPQRVNVWSYSGDLLDRNLEHFSTLIRVKLRCVPDQYRENTTIWISTNGLSYIVIEIYYFREETDEEYEKRVGEEAWKKEKEGLELAEWQVTRWTENAKRQQYLRLKEQFEGN